MARRPPSRRSMSMEEANTSRRSSTRTNPNVFSDQYAVDRDSLGPPSPSGSIDSRPEELSLDQPREPREYIPPGLPGNTLSPNRASVTKRAMPAEYSGHPSRALSTSSRSFSDPRRSLSTSSRFSIPRAQSPYRGPTAPSQPYGAYSQVTRASSVISDSTFRPQDLPFIPNGGPEHPYSMYPQNTVPDDDSSEAHVGLEFPGLGRPLQRASRSPGNEVGDIVGTDGHIEQLPPYSRYADNVIAKGDMARIDPQRSVTEESTTPTATSTAPIAEASGSDVELTAMGSRSAEDEVARKEGMSEKRRRRTFCGLPLWTVLIVVAIVVMAAVTGGVVGGVVGNQHGKHAEAGATTTVWLDADPAQTGPSTPSCPTGHYTIPLNQTNQVDSCVVDSQYAETWECLDYARLGLNIFDTSGGPPLSVVFDDYSVRPQLFRYGPQPPDFNGTSFTMQPYKDKTDDDLGVALFFSVLFDKLIIIPEDKLSLPPEKQKRSMLAPELVERGYWGDDDDDYLNVGDKPWYCFWNSTISEFWIFLDQNMDDTSQTNATSTITSASSAATTAPPYGLSMPVGPHFGSHSTSHNPSVTESNSVEPTSAAHWTGGSRAKRQANVGSPPFPKLAKMVEKRKPDDNVQPYCQQMQVLNNWQILPIPDIPTICVEESDYSAAAATGGSKTAIRRRDGDTVQQMASNCICEWFSV
ncbi:hypothetical protein H2200_005366 [Cladophialophora chaetospira]|uniref:DUF7820 domain-containing protein n=1 Tax=Cladophialophora chaetospira TaxID=386627 RepID=A0AA39CIV5_9EURO|nr:hypothetical protein H2200_005366 [Cladophialophora chaetospira]